MKNRLLIIEILKEAKEPVSGEVIAKRLGISRTAVWKNIKVLKEEGYQIETTRKGYKLIDLPDFIDKAMLKVLKYKVYYFKKVTSTMEIARELGEKGEEALIIAETQTSGRGRLGRDWISPLGGIWMSLLIKPLLSLKEAFHLTYIASLAIGLSIKELTSLNIKLKWPNDVLYSEKDKEKKLAGILLELKAEVDQLKYAIIGMGINVNNQISTLEPYGISLKEILGKDINREELIIKIIKKIDNYLKKPFEKVLRDWKELSSTLGREVKIFQPQREIRGTALDIAEDGALIIKTEDGKLEKVYSGDCIHLRY